MFTITIETDNAAFEDDAKYAEVARLLRNAAARIAQGRDDVFPLMDVNGNRVGRAQFEED